MHPKQATVVLVLVIFISISICAFAEEVPVESLLPVVEEGPTEVEAPQTTQAPPTPAIMETETPTPSEGSTSAPTEEITEEMTSTVPDEEVTEEMASTAPDEEGNSELEDQENQIELPALIPTSINISLKWEIAAEDGSLFAGDIIKLIADVTSDAEGLQYQWQVATKFASALAEGEAEWEGISSATGLQHTIMVQEDMHSFRWRLQVSTTEGAIVFSDEMRLPSFIAEDDATSQEAGVDGNAETVAVVDPLPLANIRMMSETPLDEVALGTEITLVAEIEKPRDGMLLQWQHMPAEMAQSEENLWISIEGAIGSEYTYVMDEENAGWIWRLLITMQEEEETPTEESTVDGKEEILLQDDEDLVEETESIDIMADDAPQENTSEPESMDIVPSEAIPPAPEAEEPIIEE